MATNEEAVYEWVDQLNEYPQSMIQTLMDAKPEDWQEVTINSEIDQDTLLPMWGAMWSFKDPHDNFWLEELNGVKEMSECGFRIYKHSEWGYFFGIDGAGYNFYNRHWIPAFEARIKAL